MFGKDFYPTPDNVIERMLANVDMSDKVILEPSAASEWSNSGLPVKVKNIIIVTLNRVATDPPRLTGVWVPSNWMLDIYFYSTVFLKIIPIS